MVRNLLLYCLIYKFDIEDGHQKSIVVVESW
jgi:hypothetical protein